MGMSGKAALTPDHVLCSDQCLASDVDGNNMANIASCNGVGWEGSRGSPDGPADALQQELRLMIS